MKEPATIATRTGSDSFPQHSFACGAIFFVSGSGATAFGGLAMMVYVKDLAVRKRWMDSETYNDGAAMCQALPGATVMMAVAYVGLKTRGILGALLSYVAFVFPCSCVMLFLSILYARSHTLPQIISLLSGLQVVVVAIMGTAAFKWGKDVMRSYKGAIISIAAALLLIYGLSPMAVIVIAALAGMDSVRRDPRGELLFRARRRQTRNAEAGIGARRARSLRTRRALFHRQDSVSAGGDHDEDQPVCLWRRRRLHSHDAA